MTILKSLFFSNSTLDAQSHDHPFSDFGSPKMLFYNHGCKHNPPAFRQLPPIF